MNATLNANGRERKSLAGQIDRLDRVLDGLADNLNEAVADAVKAAVGAAVREAVAGVLTEVLTNPKFVAALRGQPHAGDRPRAAVVCRPSFWQRLTKAAAWIGKFIAGLYLA